MYALVALGIVLIYKTSGIANFAQGAHGHDRRLFRLGVLRALGLPIWLAIPLAIVVMFGFGIRSSGSPCAAA